jgi:calcineurin-like phosphoesterase family protein
VSTIAIGDIHGNLAALRDVLGQIRALAGSGDTIVFLGDYIDRGSDTKGCIDAILRFQADSKGEVVCLMGNHEDWLLRTRRDYGRHSWLLGMEAFDTIRSYSADAARTLRAAAANAGPDLVLGSCTLPYEAFFDHVPAAHMRFLEALRPYHRTADCLCSHGGLDPAVDAVEEQSREALIWGAPTFPDEYRGRETLVYGHWNNALITESGRPAPRIVGHTIGIDTISSGVLTAVRLPDRAVFQSAQFR